MTTGGNSEVLVVGAGLAGLVAARQLVAAGLGVALVDKGRGVGGRLATRRIGDASLDHGAQFFTGRSARFRELLNEWRHSGWVTEWYDRGEAHGGWVYRGLPTMNSVAKNLAAGLNVTTGVVVTNARTVADGWEVGTASGQVMGARALLITCPLPQVRVILAGSGVTLAGEVASQLEGARYHRTLTLLGLLCGRSHIAQPGIVEPIGNPVIRAVIDQQRKGSSTVPAVTVNSTPEFAERYFDRPDSERGPLLIAAAEPIIGSTFAAVSIHRWGFSEPCSRCSDSFVADRGHRLWLAGDGLGGPSAERAALSGLDAAADLLQTLG